MRYFIYWYKEARKPMESKRFKGSYNEGLPIIDSIVFAWKNRKSKPKE